MQRLKYFVGGLLVSVLVVPSVSTVSAQPQPGMVQVGTFGPITYDTTPETELGLAQAASRGRTAIVEKLLRAGISPDAKDAEGWPACALAARRGYADTLQVLLARGANVNAKTPDGNTALLVAVNGGHTQTVRTLLENKADVNLANKAGETALAIATKRNYEEIIELLKEAGAK